MERRRVDNIKSLDHEIHREALVFSESSVDSSHSPLPADIRPTAFVALHPPTFATFRRQCWLVANHLSLLLVLRVLKTRSFEANFCDLNECRNDADVKHFAKCDRLLYQGIIGRPLKTKRASRIYTAQAKRVDAGQVCPICPPRQTTQPLTAPKHAAGLVKRGKGGPVVCKTCRFCIDLSAEQLEAFIHHTLRTADLVEVQMDPQGNPMACPQCAKAGRSGILLVRKPTTKGGTAHVVCSNSEKLHMAPTCRYSRAGPV